jgi:hypothetical protein
MKIGRGNRSSLRKPAPAPFCPPQIPHYQTRVWTRSAAVGSQRLTAWAMGRPFHAPYLVVTVIGEGVIIKSNINEMHMHQICQWLC